MPAKAQDDKDEADCFTIRVTIFRNENPALYDAIARMPKSRMQRRSIILQMLERGALRTAHAGSERDVVSEEAVPARACAPQIKRKRAAPPRPNGSAVMMTEPVQQPAPVATQSVYEEVDIANSVAEMFGSSIRSAPAVGGR